MTVKEAKWKTILSAVYEIIAAGLLWLLFSLPIVTMGPASTALYYAVVKCIRHERGRLWGVFWAGFRNNFRQSMRAWLLYLAALLLAAVDLYAYTHMGLRQGSPLAAFSGVLLIPALLTFPWMFAYISRFDNSLAGSLKFVSFLAVKNLGRSLLLAGEVLLFALIAWLLPQILPLIPGAFALLMSLTIEPVFRLYTADASEEGKDNWFNE